MCFECQNHLWLRSVHSGPALLYSCIERGVERHPSRQVLQDEMLRACISASKVLALEMASTNFEALDTLSNRHRVPFGRQLQLAHEAILCLIMERRGDAVRGSPHFRFWIRPCSGPFLACNEFYWLLQNPTRPAE